MSNRDISPWGVSRRSYLRGIGLAGLAAISSESALAQVTDGDAISVGNGTYATAQPAGVYDAPGEDLIFATDDVDAPYPTNGWWTRELIGAANSEGIEPFADGFGMINAVPQMVVSKEGGDGFRTFYAADWGAAPADTGNLSVDYDGAAGLDVGHAATDQFDGSHLAGYGDWHAEIQYGTGDTTLTATFTKGNAFTFCEFAGGEAAFSLVDPDDAPVGPDSGDAAVFYDDGNVLGVTVTAGDSPKHYGIFAPEGVDFDGVDDSSSLASATVTTTGLQDNGGYLSVAPLPDDASSTIEAFEAYAYNVVTDTTIDWRYDQPDSAVVTTFDFSIERKAESSTAGTMSWLFPHQHKYLAEGTSLTEYTLFSAKGTLKAWTGTSFDTVKTYRGILPELPGDQLDSSASSSLQSYVDSLIADSDVTASADDSGPYTEWEPPAATYWVGKTLYRNAVAAPVARQHASADANTTVFLDAVQDRLEHWFDATATQFDHAGQTYDTTNEDGQARELFYYDPTLGTMLGYPSGEFYLSRQMNDHHFHYGYFVHAASEVARENPGWVDEYGDFVNLLLRDYANWERPANGGDGAPSVTLDGQTPAESPTDAFPFLRNFDAYAGHSWAGGLGSWSGNNQEASSEAVNAYAAMIRWGEITGDDAIRDTGVFLYTQEVHAVWEYWFDADDTAQPDDWGANVSDPGLGGAGGRTFEYATKVRGIGFDRDLWWSPADPIEHYGINWIPTGGHSFYLGRNREYANANWQAMLDARANDPDVSAEPDADFLGGWKAAAWTYRALSNPTDAVSIADDAMSGTDGPMLKDGGNSGPVGFQFAHALDAMGTPDDVTADTTFYQVFADGTERTYVAHNAGTSEITVTFSDGYSMPVSAGETVAESSAAHYSPDETAPEQPQNLAVDGTTYNSVDLSWDAVTDEESGLFYYAVSIDDGNGFQKVAEAADPEITLTGLDPGTEYAIEISAVDLAGNESGAASATTTTDSADTAVPATPDAPFAIEWDASSVEVGWSTVDAPDFGIAHYNVYVDGEKAAEADGPPYELTGLSGEEIDVTVSAINEDPAGNESEQSEPITVTLAGPGTNEPYFAAPQPLPGRLQVEYFDEGGSNAAYRDTTAGQEASASLRTDTSVAIGSDAPNGYNIAYTAQYEWLEYTVEVDSAGTYDVVGSYANNTGEPGGPIQLEVDGEVVGGPYDVPSNGSWQEFAQDTLGQVDLEAGEQVVRLYCEGGGFNLDWLQIQSPESSADESAPEAPTGLASASVGEYSVDLEWDVATDGESAVFRYVVYQDGSPVATVGDTTATVEALTGGTEYEFAVTAIDAFGNESRQSDALAVTTEQPADDATPPTAPGTLRPVARTRESLDLAWDAATDNVGVDHYVVSVDGETALETDRTWATIDDLDEATTYDVSVTAVDAAGNEGDPVAESVTTADQEGQAPYTDPIEVPGTIHAEEFDTGGQDVAYYDTTPGNEVNIQQNGGIERRSDTDVDIGALDGDYNVGFIAGDEWMEYTIEVPSTGLYDVAYEVTTASGGTFHLEVDGVDVTGEVSVASTGGWTSYQPQGPIEGVPLTEGTHVLRFVSGGGFNLNHFEVSPSGGPELDRSDWTASASQESQWETPPSNALDGDDTTEWASGAPAIADAQITFTVDMGATETISQVSVDHLEAASFPATFDLQCSVEGQEWTTVRTLEGAQSIVTSFPPTDARYVRLVDRDEQTSDWWKITEFRAFEAASDLKDDETAPAAPTDLAVESQNGYQATLSWTAPTADDRHHYAIAVDGAHARNVGTGVDSPVVPGLTPGETHEIAVTAVDAAGNVSDPVTTTVDASVALQDYTATPTELSASTLELRFEPDGRVSDASVTVQRNGGEAQTHELVDDGGSWYVVLGSLAADDTVDYTFEYERVGEVRETDQHTHEFVGDSAAGGPSNLSVEQSGPASVTLSWDAPSATVDEYAVLEGTTAVAFAGGDATEIQVTGLSSQTRYRFGVVGIVYEGGDTPLSNTVTVETPSYSATQSNDVADAWVSDEAPESVAIPADAVDYGTVRDAGANAEEGDE